MVINMEKASIIIKINDNIIKGIGTKDKYVLTLETQEEKIIYDLHKSILIKENNELKIVMDFKNKQIEYTLIAENKKFHNNFIINRLTNHHKQVIIKYRIEDTDFNLEINYETI